MNSPKINKNNSKERLQKDKIEEFYTRIGARNRYRKQNF